ncbi:MAG: preQ(1) synthase [Elusimicrobia bacterium]|nr:preQ(1) synthase [Elusimicrobiota bacterium]
MSNNSKDKFSLLGGGNTRYPQSPDKAKLEAFDNPSAGRDYTVKFKTGEFTSLCPVTGQPDFAEIIIEYVPEKSCIESKSLKLYLFSFRNYGGFAEDIVNRILEDVVAACKPKYAGVEGKFTARGGITIDVKAEYKERTNK